MRETDTMEPTRDNPAPSEIDGIADCGPTKEGRDYAVTLTLYLERTAA